MNRGPVRAVYRLMSRHLPALIALLLPAGCTNATGDAAVVAEAPATASPDQPAAPPSAEAPPEASCTPTIISRTDELEEGSPECTAAFDAATQQLESGPACTTDAGCVIAQIAGGCMGAGVPASAADAPSSVPASCLPASCAEADFTDHQVRCEAGCCVVFET